MSPEGIEPSPHGVRIRHAANKHLKLMVESSGNDPEPRVLKARCAADYATTPVQGDVRFNSRSILSLFMVFFGGPVWS